MKKVTHPTHLPPDLLKPLVRKATAVTPTPLKRGTEATITATKFGGTPYAEAGEAWPRCGGCGEGLSFIFQWNLTECPHDRGRASIFTLFYCHACGPFGDPTDDLRDAWVLRRYTRPALDRAAVLDDASPAKLRTRPCGVRLGNVRSLPDSQEVERLDPRAWDAAQKVNPEAPWDAYRKAAEVVLGGPEEIWTQVGGYAVWVQGAAVPECAACHEPMTLLAQVANEPAAGLTWGERDGLAGGTNGKKGCVYLFECPAHPDQISMMLQS